MDRQRKSNLQSLVDGNPSCTNQMNPPLTWAEMAAAMTEMSETDKFYDKEMLLAYWSILGASENRAAEKRAAENAA